MVQNALLRRFEDSGKILSVARPGSGVRGEFQLQTDLRVFESVYVNAAQPQAQVEIYAKLVKASSGEVVAARTLPPAPRLLQARSCRASSTPSAWRWRAPATRSSAGRSSKATAARRDN